MCDRLDPSVRCTGLWYAFDYRCRGTVDCIKSLTYPGATLPPRRVPDASVEWVGHVPLSDGSLNSVLTIKGEFVDLSLVVYDVAPPQVASPGAVKYPAVRGRLPEWNGLRCPYCDKPNADYDIARGDQRRHLRISYSVRAGPQPDVCILRLNSEDALAFWMEFELPAWLVRK